MGLLKEMRDWFDRLALCSQHQLSRSRLNSTRRAAPSNLGSPPARSRQICPRPIQAAIAKLKEVEGRLRTLTANLPQDPWALRVVVDTNVLIDNPDVAAYESELDGRHLVHLLPVVLGELDDLKLFGKTLQVREAASKAIRRIKGIRSNAKHSEMRVQGEIFAVFEHVDPRVKLVPAWLNLNVPDDRLLAVRS